ncbi:MAG: coproporphyrinogen III oxidase family protein [Bacteroidales bacterium]|nr:coproporphyrinogen III oxidase family protein [Bacteroidales bacterium]
MVYLHVPFCRSFCTYCDFYSEIACRGRDAQTLESYADALCAEISRRRDEIEGTRDLDTFYIGGGTPSVLPLSLLRKVAAQLLSGGVPPEPPASPCSDSTMQQAERAGASWRAEPPAGQYSAFTEFTVEVNPEDIVEKGPAYVQGLREIGVNRISMGVQSLDDGILRWMNRRHDAAHAREAFRLLREAGMDNLSVDLIFGLPQLSEALLDKTIDEVLQWRAEHISAYQLSIEEGSTLGRLVREGRYAEAPQEQCAAQYARLCARLHEAGYVHYEISNWALPGREAVHNSAYWTRHPYVGLGPGAHSFDGRTRSWNSRTLAGWTRESETLSAAEAREEDILLGLRTARGIPEAWLVPARTAPLLSDGRLVRIPDGRVRIPEDHWFVSDDIIADLI